MCSDPPGNLLDGGALELPSSRAILEGRVPSRGKKRGGLEVAGLRGKKRRLGETDTWHRPSSVSWNSRPIRSVPA